jgi:hypothetical protein
MSSPATVRRATMTTMSTDRADSTAGAKVNGPRSYFPSIEKKYGKPIDEWMALLATAGTTKHMELVAWLKDEHGIGHGHANALVAVYLDPTK